jgi:hypothetical protein
MKIVDYALVKCADAVNLETQIKSAIKLGWQPQGGPFYAEERKQYVQAMVLPEPTVGVVQFDAPGSQHG